MRLLARASLWQAQRQCTSYHDGYSKHHNTTNPSWSQIAIVACRIMMHALSHASHCRSVDSRVMLEVKNCTTILPYVSWDMDIVSCNTWSTCVRDLYVPILILYFSMWESRGWYNCHDTSTDPHALGAAGVPQRHSPGTIHMSIMIDSMIPLIRIHLSVTFAPQM